MVSVADRVTTTTSSGKHGDQTTVNAVPEVWIVDASGQELCFVDTTLTHCRAGHEVILVSDATRVLGMGNLSTRYTWHSPELMDKPINGAFLLEVLVKLSFFVFLALLVLGTLLQGGSGRSWFTVALLNVLLIGSLGAAIWLPISARTTRNQRNEALRAQIDQEIAAA